MTQAQCDSTTDVETLQKHEHPHSPGCVGGGSVCTRSLLRLALTSGSAYAIRFTTCVIGINDRAKHTEWTKRKASQRTAPYRKKKKYGYPSCVRKDRQPHLNDGPEVISDDCVSSSTESNQSADITRVKSTTEEQHCGQVTTDAPVQSQRVEHSRFSSRTGVLLKELSTLPESG